MSAHGLVSSDTEDEHCIQNQYFEHEIEPNMTAQDDKKKRNGTAVERKEVHDIHDSAAILTQMLPKRFGDGILPIGREAFAAGVSHVPVSTYNSSTTS